MGLESTELAFQERDALLAEQIQRREGSDLM